MTTAPGTPPDLAAIRERYTKFMQGGQFIAESERQPDGTRCPTGHVGFLGAPNYGDPDDDPYSPDIISFQDREDAPAFVEILADHAALLAEVERLRDDCENWKRTALRWTGNERAPRPDGDV